MQHLKICLAFIAASTVPIFSVAAQEHDAVNEANNPLTPKITVNFHNYYVPELTDVPDKYANQFLLRGLIPSNLFGAPQLFRFTLPIATAPTFPDGETTGLGDLTLMDLFMFPGKEVSFGAGPLLVLPTASDDVLGAGKWQAGLAGVAIAPQSWGLVGGLATYQASFAGDGDRDEVSLATVQPILNINLKDGFYLRSSATWNFDLEDGDYSIPVGFGVGKVIPLNDKVTMNAFVEPQYTVFSHGTGQPEWQIFAGVNFQFAVGK
ncbi:hypothetical protein [Brucella thiophenivorans]|uniref:Neuromedin U n=1 Tax=Brucella thiophenivorans TaxID=571255 RepID=A0A256FJS8_9HYPH|nr:hypothetical protein [Brucella thiophenivorans]OYR14946.1 hypothetical protein CEV31_3153 [Brucella thiophenivorans]